jgi:phosphatidylserine/phosphatidylglycerophosphate/cardiolipin synthase-like enzyme
MSEQPPSKRTGSRRIRRKFSLQPETERKYDRENRQAEFLALSLNERKQRWLAAYETCYGLSARACKAIGCPHSEVLIWRDSDPDFAERMDELSELADESLRNHIMERAMGLDGERPSDLLAIFEAKRRMPHYRDKEQAVNVHISDNRTQNMVVLHALAVIPQRV